MRWMLRRQAAGVGSEAGRDAGGSRCERRAARWADPWWATRSSIAPLLLAGVVGAAPLGAHVSGVYSVRATFLPEGTYRVDVSLGLEHAISPEEVAGATGQAPPPPPSSGAAVSPAPAGPPLAGLPESLETLAGTFLASYVDRAVLAFDGRPIVPQRGGEAPADGHLVTGDFGGPGRMLLRYTGPIPRGAHTFTFRGPDEEGSFTLAARNVGDQAMDVQEVLAGEPSRAFLLDERLVPPSRLAVVGRYLVLGFTHILPKGLDHILFVLGLFLLSQAWRPLLWQVSAFTLAHTLTLGLSIYGVVSLPSSLVEPLIAASIVYVAVENVISPKLRPWRVALVFAFGLLHGLGFAGVLSELGLPRGELFTALLSFNLGVELGQLAVIAGAFLLLALPLRKRSWYRRAVVVPASLAIAAVGLYWAVERTVGALGG